MSTSPIHSSSSSTSTTHPPAQVVHTTEDALRLLMHRNEAMQQQIVQLQQQQQAIRPIMSASTVIPPTSFSNSALKPSKPATFQGDRHSNADVWCLTLENYFQATGIEDPHRVPFAVSQLREDAVIWWSNEIRSNKQLQLQPIHTWDEFKKVFLAQYQPVEASEMARAALDGLRQRGPVESYCNQFLHHLHHIKNSTVEEQLFLFKKGLQDHIRTEVRMAHPTTLQQAMSLAIQADVETRGQRNQYPFRHTPPSTNQRTNPWPRFNPSFTGHANASMPHAPVSTQHPVPMDLGNVQMSDVIVPNEKESGLDLYAIQQRGSGGGWRASGGLSRTEFDRCRQQHICFRCKRPGHVARNCTYNGVINPSKNTQSQQ